MSTLADCWVPVPLRWRHVQPGDVIVGADGALWAIDEIDDPPWGGVPEIHARSAGVAYVASVDPDEVVTVLVPVPERDALGWTRDVLGARVTERRAAA